MKRALTGMVLFVLCVIAAAGESIQPLTFSQAADLAVRSSAELRSEYRGLQIRENAWMLGFRNYLPRLNLSAQENDRLQRIGPDSFIKNYSIGMDQLLWDGGRLLMSRRLERMELNIMHSRIDRMGDDIAEAALYAYRSVLSARAILAIRETALAALAAQLFILEKELELGLALPLDYFEAQLALTEARMEIISLESDIAEMEKQFAEMLGLETLPLLAETIDIRRSALLPGAQASVALAEDKNPELAEARFSIAIRQAEYTFASRSWLPAVRFHGSFSLSGQQYPLTRHTWSAGLSIEFAGPWLHNTMHAQAGWEARHDRTAIVQNNATPAPDPAASMGRRQAKLLLDLEKENYDLAFERTGRFALRALERCRLADRRRSLAVEAIEIAISRYRLEEIRLSLGEITRLELIQAYITWTEREIAAVESAIALMDAERELERLLDLKPGELAAFARANISNGGTL